MLQLEHSPLIGLLPLEGAVSQSTRSTYNPVRHKQPLRKHLTLRTYNSTRKSPGEKFRSCRLEKSFVVEFYVTPEVLLELSLKGKK